MTYLQFHLAFLLPPIVALALTQPRPLGGEPPWKAARALGLIVSAALLYTTPWDNYLVFRGVWGYGPERVLGTIGYVPVEEYAFFVLQPVLTGLVYFSLRVRLPTSPSVQPAWFRWLGVGVWGGLALVGAALLLAGVDRTLYLGLILAWASPVLAGLSHLGAAHVWADRRAVALSIALPTLYLWVADRTAIALGIWDIADRYSLGIDPLGLPVEEAAFFLVTNVLCVIGLAMLLPLRTPAEVPA